MISTIKDKFLGSKFLKFRPEVNGRQIINGMRAPVTFVLESDRESDPEPIPAKLELSGSLSKRQKKNLRKLTSERQSVPRRAFFLESNQQKPTEVHPIFSTHKIFLAKRDFFSMRPSYLSKGTKYDSYWLGLVDRLIAAENLFQEFLEPFSIDAESNYPKSQRKLKFPSKMKANTGISGLEKCEIGYYSVFNMKVGELIEGDYKNVDLDCKLFYKCMWEIKEKLKVDIEGDHDKMFKERAAMG